MVEAFVFRGNKCLLYVRGNVRERDPDATLVLLEHLGEAFALAVEHDAGAGKLQSLQLGVIGQVGGRLVVEMDNITEIDRRLFDLVVFAELPIGRMQVGEVETTERLDLVGERLRVVERERDQLIEVDVLEVEGLEHMRAACSQLLGNQGLVPGTVEAGLHRIRCSRHLTERQSRAEDFDQERFHLRGFRFQAWKSRREP